VLANGAAVCNQKTMVVATSLGSGFALEKHSNQWLLYVCDEQKGPQ
jgi:hypothetical protein